MTLLVTGAAGFVGRAVTRRLASASGGPAVRLLDVTPPPVPDDPRFTAITADLAAPGAVATALDGVDSVIHLAALPGGAAEADPAASRYINIDTTLAMLEHLDRAGRPARFVYASSIAVFGDLSAPIGDHTLPTPALVYGAHKQMVEIALADFVRRGRVRGLALRLPGIVARPRGASGLKSAFMSDMFHAARAGERFVMPVGPEATIWVMSAACAAANLVHALSLDVLDGRALTLPALRLRIADLVGRLFADPAAVSYVPDTALQALFGALPPLATPAANALGFAHDGDVEGLIAAVAA